MPATTDVVELAFSAIMHCCFAEDGSWNNQPRAFLAVLDFIESETTTTVSTNELQYISDLIRTGNSNLDRIKFWLEAHFRITPIVPAPESNQ